ncbi:MAG: hypothetical protein JST12_13525 [Armatimonadetes bacterium]|nr:hypothetical protein [Armatimonadota bacterium]MBS1702678.1 hypothetical protein [Armatimonadota bacterium]MBS1726643.1 hypothetical protein [Armatimonadota bacterium]
MSSRREKDAATSLPGKALYRGFLNRDRQTVFWLPDGSYVEIMVDRDVVGMVSIYAPDAFPENGG